MLPLSSHVRLDRLSFFYGFYGFLRTLNLRSRLTILSNLNSGGRERTHTLFVKSRARSSQCCGLSFTRVKNVKVCKELRWNPAVGDLLENQGHCRDLGFVFLFFSFKKSNGNSQGLIRLSKNLYRRRCTKTKQIMRPYYVTSSK